MLSKLRSRASFSNVIALTALFVALSGTSYAVTTFDSKKIKNNTIRSIDIKNRTIRSKDIAQGVIGSTLQATPRKRLATPGPRTWVRTLFTPVATLGGFEPGAYVLLAKVNQSADGSPMAVAASRPRATSMNRTVACARRARRRATTSSRSIVRPHRHGGACLPFLDRYLGGIGRKAGRDPDQRGAVECGLRLEPPAVRAVIRLAARTNARRESTRHGSNGLRGPPSGRAVGRLGPRGPLHRARSPPRGGSEAARM